MLHLIMSKIKRIYIPVSDENIKAINQIAKDRQRSVAFVCAEMIEKSIESQKNNINIKQ